MLSHVKYTDGVVGDYMPVVSEDSLVEMTRETCAYTRSALAILQRDGDTIVATNQDLVDRLTIINSENDALVVANSVAMTALQVETEEVEKTFAAVCLELKAARQNAAARIEKQIAANQVAMEIVTKEGEAKVGVIEGQIVAYNKGVEATLATQLQQRNAEYTKYVDGLSCCNHNMSIWRNDYLPKYQAWLVLEQLGLQQPKKSMLEHSVTAQTWDRNNRKNIR